MTAGVPLGPEAPQVVGAARTAARRLLDANVKLAEIPSSEKKARDVIEMSAAGRVPGQEGERFVGVFIDPTQMGETVTAPHIRSVPVDQITIKARLPCRSMSRSLAATAGPLKVRAFVDNFFHAPGRGGGRKQLGGPRRLLTIVAVLTTGFCKRRLEVSSRTRILSNDGRFRVGHHDR